MIINGIIEAIISSLIQQKCINYLSVNIVLETVNMVRIIPTFMKVAETYITGVMAFMKKK